MQTYANLKAFYKENPARERSGEADYGVWWTAAGKPYLRRVSYIRYTGEVYAVQEIPGGEVELLGIVPPDDGDIYYLTLDRILEGWAGAIHQPDSLTWVRSKLARQEANYEKGQPDI